MESLQTAAQVKMLNSMGAGRFTRARQPFGGTVVWSWWRAIAVDFNYMHPSCGLSKTTADRHDGPSKITAKIRSQYDGPLCQLSLKADGIGPYVAGCDIVGRQYWPMCHRLKLRQWNRQNILVWQSQQHKQGFVDSDTHQLKQHASHQPKSYIPR